MASSLDFSRALLPLLLALAPACATVPHDVGSDGDSGKDTGDKGEGGASDCVTVDLSTYDHSCDKDSDCITVTRGPVCAGYYAYCELQRSCGGVAISASEQARYESAVASVTPDTPPYSCPECAPPRCIEHTCTVCSFDLSTNDASCPFDGGSPEAAPPSDAGCYFPSLDASCPRDTECTIESSLCGGGSLQVTCSATGQGMIEPGCTLPDGG